MYQTIDLYCPSCNKKFAETEKYAKVEVIGKFNNKIHENLYDVDPCKYNDHIMVKCHNCKSIIAFKTVDEKELP